MSALGSERIQDVLGRIELRYGAQGRLRQVIDPAVALVFEVDPKELGAATRRSRAPHSPGKWPCT
ncbi:hypothetical protein [Methyloceanibacter methanicus]|uniref:hypothetical protein n=1 Tax=Methyloceanibacter methanicus TaxID=1774968 RepID=UPI00114CA776|nr:hypothetical protein [Methyloceanibacter methanicus]